MTNFNEQELREIMLQSAREDRERFFKVADSLRYQSSFDDKSFEIEQLRRFWRDMTLLPDFPNVDFPFVLPDWFPKVNFASFWKKDVYIEENIYREPEVILEDD